MKKGILLLALISLFSFSHIAFADETVWQLAKSPDYGKKVGGMLGRGLVNAATCFVDLVVQTVNGTKDGPPFVGTLTGLGGGLACTALRATSGVLDVATFWVPGFNGIPVSKSYNNCLEMEEETTNYAPPAEAPVQEAPAAETKVSQRKHSAYDYVKK